MATIPVKLLFSGLLVTILFQYGYGCSCYPQTLKELYCKATFVAKFKILSDLQVPLVESSSHPISSFFQFQDGYYKVRMAKRTWKFPEDIKVNKRRLYTPSNDGMCKLYLSPGEVYVISGRVGSDGTLHVDMCSSMSERTPISRKLRRWRSNPPTC